MTINKSHTEKLAPTDITNHENCKNEENNLLKIDDYINSIATLITSYIHILLYSKNIYNKLTLSFFKKNISSFISYCEQNNLFIFNKLKIKKRLLNIYDKSNFIIEIDVIFSITNNGQLYKCSYEISSKNIES